MNKILLTSCLSLLGLSSIAQQKMDHQIEGLVPEKNLQIVKSTDFATQGQKTIFTETYNYAGNLDALGVGGTYYSSIMHPDSLKYEYTNGWGYASWASFGQVFDPTSEFWAAPAMPLRFDDEYTINYVEFGGRYRRPQNNVPDTLRLHIFTEDVFTGGTVGPNNFKSVAYDYTQNKGVGYAKEIDMILDITDTSSGKNYKFDNIAFDVPKGEEVAFTLTFVPGNTYAIGDTLDAASGSKVNFKNYFVNFIYDDPTETTEMADEIWNDGLMIRMSQRYNVDTLGSNGFYYPGMGYIGINRHWDVDNNLTTDTKVGLEDAEAFKSIDLYPNPFSSIATLEFNLETATQLELNVFDITGKMVQSIPSAVYPAGTNKLTINGESLENGLYYLNIIANDGIVTKKMVVNN